MSYRSQTWQLVSAYSADVLRRFWLHSLKALCVGGRWVVIAIFSLFSDFLLHSFHIFAPILTRLGMLVWRGVRLKQVACLYLDLAM